MKHEAHAPYRRVVNSTVAEQEPSSYNLDMSTSPSNLANTLQRLRHQAGLSLRDLEEASGVARSVISRVENGQYLSPTPSTLTRLASGLGADASELLTAAGYTATQAEGLPSMRPYLRSKYGHLSADARKQVESLLADLEGEQVAKRTRKGITSKTSKKQSSRERRS
jgi:transcriptional regulator with XRE-family HTH domain